MLVKTWNVFYKRREKRHKNTINNKTIMKKEETTAQKEARALLGLFSILKWPEMLYLKNSTGGRLTSDRCLKGEMILSTFKRWAIVN